MNLLALLLELLGELLFLLPQCLGFCLLIRCFQLSGFLDQGVDLCCQGNGVGPVLFGSGRVIRCYFQVARQDVENPGAQGALVHPGVLVMGGSGT